eukprot:scaffold6789_cov115-Isochrysis_galbana.AAC.3
MASEKRRGSRRPVGGVTRIVPVLRPGILLVEAERARELPLPRYAQLEARTHRQLPVSDRNTLCA